MKVKKIILLVVFLLLTVGCTKVKDLSYDEIVNNITNKAKNVNTYRNGYSYYIPSGLKLDDAGSNYAILKNNDTFYYLYFDLVSFNEGKIITHELTNELYSKNINYDGKSGYVEIKLRENNQYLIEIMYNYAKIELMVDKDNANVALLNAINILNSVKYDKKVIENMLKDDNSIYTEEIFDMFQDAKNSSDYLDYVEDEDSAVTSDKIKDTDYIN